jgi:predicted Zn-dependent protease
MAREAVARYSQGEREEGLSEVRRALAAGPSEYWVQLSAAQLFSSAALLSDAARVYGQLAARDSANMWMWVQYGSAAYLAGQLEEARRAFDHVDALHPQQVWIDPAWRAMRDAARKGIRPSDLPPIPPYTGKPKIIEMPGRR